VLSLYRQLLRESNKFNTHAYAAYCARRTREEFRLNKNETDTAKIAALVQKAQQNREIIKRQAFINSMYATNDSILHASVNSKE